MPKSNKFEYKIVDKAGTKLELRPKGARFLLSLSSGNNIMGEPVWEHVFITAEQLEEMSAFARKQS